MDSGKRFSDSPSPPLPLSPKHRHQFALWLSACFGAAGNSRVQDSAGGVGERKGEPLLCSHSKLIHFKTQELPERRGKCRALVSCHYARNHHRGYNSSNFMYDPLSYALNFDEGLGSECAASAEDLRHRRFSFRLPASPPRTVGVPLDKALE